MCDPTVKAAVANERDVSRSPSSPRNDCPTVGRILSKAGGMTAVPLTAAQAKDRLGCSLSFVYKEFKRGRLRGNKIGKDIRIWPHSIEEYQRENANSPEVLPNKANVNRPSARPKKAKASAGLGLKFL